MSTPSDFCIGCINDEYPEGLQHELADLRAKLAEKDRQLAEAEEYATELTRLFNDEVCGATRMGEPVVIPNSSYEQGRLAGRAEMQNDVWVGADGELPAIGQKVILFSNGVVQEEIYMLDAHDRSDMYIEYFWSRDYIEDSIEIKQTDRWAPLPQPPKPTEGETE